MRELTDHETDPAVADGIANEILTERKRQLEKHGWSDEHDDQHIHAQITKAAICYADPWASARDDCPPESWPWSARWWRPEKTYRANLVKAAALLMAEIERVDRREAKNGGQV